MEKLTIRTQLVLLVLLCTVPALGVALYIAPFADVGVFASNIAAIAAATLLAAAIAWWGVELLILRRIRGLLDAANRVRGGDFSVRTYLSHGKGEISQLGAAFDAMAETLQQRDTELRNAMLELHAQATTDPLTRLSNRRQLSEVLPREVMRARRADGKMGNGKLAALLIDLDHFKKINDTFGHKAGDVVLRHVAKLLQGCVRKGDLVGRYGGDEFTVLLNHVKAPSDAVRVAQTILSKLQTPIPVGETVKVGASIGIALSTNPHERAEDLIRDADAAMYRAKAQGKNGYAISDQSDIDNADLKERWRRITQWQWSSREH